MQERNEIDEKYKWKLDMIKSDDEIEQVFKDIEFLTEELPKFNGRLNDADMFFKYMHDYDAQNLRISKLEFYISNALNIDSADTKLLKLADRLSNALNKLNKATAFLSAQLDDLPEDY